MWYCFCSLYYFVIQGQHPFKSKKTNYDILTDTAHANIERYRGVNMQDGMTLHDSKTFAIILLIISLSILDAFFTLELISLGARETNPIMCYYLKHGALVFFAVKYLLTFASILLVLALKERYGARFTVSVRTILAFPVIALGIVVQWEVYLIYF
jgi:hypothetical protein